MSDEQNGALRGDGGPPADDDEWWDDDGYEADCHWCAGEGWVECPDPIECTRSHRTYTGGGGAFIQECRCGSCGGSGDAKDMTIW